MADEHDDRMAPGVVSRRRLLVGGAAVGGAMAANADAGEPDEAAQPEQSPDPRRLTYRETEHIRSFYRRSRI